MGLIKLVKLRLKNKELGRCKAIISSGDRCSYKANAFFGYCLVHYRINYTVDDRIKEKVSEVI